MNLYLIIAPRRSGHHAIVHWFNSILKGRGIIINDTDWVKKPLQIPDYVDNKIKYLDHDLKVKYKKTNDISYCIFNIEERDLNLINDHLNKDFGWDNLEIIIVQRSFLNFYASKKFHHVESIDGRLENGVAVWLQYTKEILGRSNILDRKFTHILFDEWFKSKQYRKKLCKKFGGIFKNEKTEKVPRNGNGSTFDKMKKDGNAKSMDVLNREKKIGSEDIIKFENYIDLSNNLKGL